MNHRVPEFDVDEFCTAPSSSQSRPKNMQDDEIMELVWHNGQLGVQNQNQRLFRKPSPPSKSQQHHMPPSYPTEQPPPPPESASTTHLYMQEDEMTSWLHYPIDDDTSFDQHITDLFYNPPGPPAAPPSSSARALPPADLRSPPPPPPPAPQPHHQTRPPAHPSSVGINFPHFARPKPRVPESGQSASSTNNELRESTVVDSSDTTKSPLSPVWSSAVKFSGGGIAGMSTAGCGGGSTSTNKDAETYGGSGSGGSPTATADLMARPPSDDRKRKGIESEDPENQSEDQDIESYEEKKQYRGTGSGKRSRAAEVHNLSERKRRDRINEKMKALQQLIPRCTKTDKASMLDEAIEYMKSLQMQLQVHNAVHGVLRYGSNDVSWCSAVHANGDGDGNGDESTYDSVSYANTGSVIFHGSKIPIPSFSNSSCSSIRSNKSSNQSDGSGWQFKLSIRCKRIPTVSGCPADVGATYI